LTVRLPPALLRRLEAAAAAAQHSLSQEVEMRCEAYETAMAARASGAEELVERTSEADEPELQALAGQLKPFEQSLQKLVAASAIERPGPGRRPSTRNKRIDERVMFYTSCFGDPLARAIQISTLPILAKGVLGQLARIIGVTKSDAMHWWLDVVRATVPFVHPPLAPVSAVGPPDGESLN
jgi:hypothetical protein